MSTLIDVRLVEGPLPPSTANAEAGTGAVWLFEGIVRPLENNRPLVALEYEAYEPMTTQELRRLADQISTDCNLLSIVVEHSIGRVAPGECSFRLIVTSPHRAAGHQAAGKFIDMMKRHVPLWKNPIYSLSNRN